MSRPGWIRCDQCGHRTPRSLADADCDAHRRIGRSPLCERMVATGRRCPRLSVTVDAGRLAVCRHHAQEEAHDRTR